MTELDDPIEFPALRDGPEMNALKHGVHSQRLQEAAAPWREVQLGAIRADLGEDLSTLKAHTVNQIGTVLVILKFLGGNLMADGPLTSKGRQRAALTAYLSVLDRYMRLTDKLGLDRVAKSVPTLAEVMK